MVEAGWLRSAPRPKRPIEALHAIAADFSLSTSVDMRGGESRTALEIQRYYLQRARDFVSASHTPSMEAHDVIGLWSGALDALETDPGSLVGRLDWVTKRFLLEECETSDEAHESAFRKKIDLRYHELRDGYFKKLQRAGEAPRLLTSRDVARAVREPPQATPAKLRGRLIGELADSTAKVRVDWDTVRIGGRLRAEVIELAEYRQRAD
jgi:hypothetical protein